MLFVCALALTCVPLWAQAPACAGARARRSASSGVVRDETNAIALPGVPVEVVDTKEVVYTDVDGRYVLQVPPGKHTAQGRPRGLSGEDHQHRGCRSDAHGRRRADDGEVRRDGDRRRPGASTCQTSSAEAQLIERRQASVITDNIGSQEMKQNGDSDAAAAMSRVTGLSLVDNQYVFVRGLGERYSNTTLAGSVLPTTEPDKKVVPLDLFPTGLIDSVQVNKSYSPDRSAEFAGGLVQIVPMKLPNQPVLDFSYGVSHYSTATGKSIPLSPLGSRDVWGYDNGARALPSGIPGDKIVRQGIYTPDVGYTRERDHRIRPAARESVAARQTKDGEPGQNWSATLGNRFGEQLGIVASVTHSYKEQFVEEDRGFFRISGAGRAREHQPVPHPDRHPEGAARRRRQPVLSVQSQPAADVRELLHAQRPRRGPILPGHQPRQRARIQELPAAVHRGRTDLERHRRRALLPEPLEQPARLARELRARDPRRTGSARDALRAAVRRRRAPARRSIRSPTPTSRRAASACSTS